MKTSTPLDDSRRKQISNESLSSVNTDSGSKSMDTSDSQFYAPGTDVETEKIVKDEENRNRQSHDNCLQSKCLFYLNYLRKHRKMSRSLPNSSTFIILGPSSSESSSNLLGINKSTYGQWKRRKGQAPKRPIPQRRVIKVLPMSEIRRELDLIEVQQQGLEKQGVKIEQIIREKCEGKQDADAESPGMNLFFVNRNVIAVVSKFWY